MTTNYDWGLRSLSWWILCRPARTIGTPWLDDPRCHHVGKLGSSSSLVLS